MSGAERVTDERAGREIEGQSREDQGRELDQAQAAAQGLTLEAALADFRSSVQAWSEAASSRPRTVQSVVPHRSAWGGGMNRMAAAWALGCVLLAGGVSAGVWQHHRQDMQMAAARAAEQEQAAAELRAQQAKENEKDSLAHNLLAQVDSDVSQEVPTAMEPLARLMVDADAQ